jgi:hypothetical protein
MIPREILKKIRQIELRTNRIVTVLGSARVARAGFGVAPKISSYKLSPRMNPSSQSNVGSGATPEPARGTRALPFADGARASARFTARTPAASKTNPALNSIRPLRRRERRAPALLSLTPGFSPVTGEGESLNRFNGFPRAAKPLKRLKFASRVHTGLKPGVNERDFTRANSPFAIRHSKPIEFDGFGNCGEFATIKNQAAVLIPSNSTGFEFKPVNECHD